MYLGWLSHCVHVTLGSGPGKRAWQKTMSVSAYGKTLVWFKCVVRSVGKSRRWTSLALFDTSIEAALCRLHLLLIFSFPIYWEFLEGVNCISCFCNSRSKCSYKEVIDVSWMVKVKRLKTVIWGKKKRRREVVSLVVKRMHRNV